MLTRYWPVCRVMRLDDCARDDVLIAECMSWLAAEFWHIDKLVVS